MKILVLGVTGVAGHSATPLLVGAGHNVLGHVRHDVGRRWLEGLGAEPVEGDSLDPVTLRSWLRGCDAVMDLRVRIPGAASAPLPWSWREYAHLRGHECGVVVDAALDTDVPRVIRDTVTMTYDDGGDEWLTEESPTRASGALAANLVAERNLARLTEAGGTGVAVRFAGFYGPDDEFSQEVMAAARKGRSLTVGPSEGWTSAIHTDDAGSVLLAALDVPAGIYNATDDEPMTRGDLLGLFSEVVGRPVRPYPGWTARFASSPVRALRRSQRVSNARLRELGWRPSVLSRRNGWPQAFARNAGDA